LGPPTAGPGRPPAAGFGLVQVAEADALALGEVDELEDDELAVDELEADGAAPAAFAT
jgi:hypothetical protein